MVLNWWDSNPVRVLSITGKSRPTQPSLTMAPHRPLSALGWHNHSHACRKGGHGDRGFPGLAGRSHGDQGGSCCSLRTSHFENSRDT